MKWQWVLAFIPLTLGLAVAVLLASDQLANPTLRLRADLGTLVVLTGLSLSAALAALLALRAWAQRVRLQGFVRAQSQASEERRRFLQRLDHELKNPLTAIRAGLANLAQNAPQSHHKTLGSIATQTLRLSRLTADLRKLAELEIRPLECTSVNLADLLQEVVESAQDQHKMNGRRLSLTLPQAPWPLPAVRAIGTCFSWPCIICSIMPSNSPAQEIPWKSEPLRMVRRWSSKWRTPGQAFRRQKPPTCGKNYIAARARVACRAAGWVWPWCVPSSSATMVIRCCAVAPGRVRWSPCGCLWGDVIKR